MPHTPDNTYTYVAWAVLNRIAREAARFIERQEELLERSILSVLKCEFVPVTRAEVTILSYLPIYFLPSLVESRIGRNVICWVGRLLNDGTAAAWWTSSVLLRKIYSSLWRKKNRGHARVTFFFASFCYKPCPFQALSATRVSDAKFKSVHDF